MYYYALVYLASSGGAVGSMLDVLPAIQWQRQRPCSWDLYDTGWLL
jgi:hypothetical protein